MGERGSGGCMGERGSRGGCLGERGSGDGGSRDNGGRLDGSVGECV